MSRWFRIEPVQMIKQLTSRIQSRNLAKGARVALAAGQRNTERATNGTRRRNQWNTELANKGTEDATQRSTSSQTRERKTQPNGARARKQRNRELASKGTGNSQAKEQGTRKQRNRELASKGTGNSQSTELSDSPDAPITLMTRPETIEWKIPANQVTQSGKIASSFCGCSRSVIWLQQRTKPSAH